MLETCEGLPLDRAVVFVSDCDPKLLDDRLESEQPGKFSWEYLESGPDVWQIRVRRKA